MFGRLREPRPKQGIERDSNVADVFDALDEWNPLQSYPDADTEESGRLNVFSFSVQG
jgi:hypothetical protein